MLDGVASGVLAHNGSVWFTDIPSLWKLDGLDKDGHAEKREELSRGYGVRYSYTGHDMHGLILGPDGLLYFSFGDRGANVKTKEGVQLAFPDEGAVFRCEPDGSHMEVFCRGLRNPQELAFDKFGNLFTGDNDSDQGDKERWEYLVPGGDYGWRVGWQHHPLGKENNPWLEEKLWVPVFPGQAAWIIPPIANIPDGPSGLAYYPGTGLDVRYRDHFFLCSFKGTSAKSAIFSWESQPIGAGFRLNDEHTFVGSAQATDITFGPDSKMYFSEWGEGWEGTGRGRIFRVYDQTASLAPQVEEVRKMLATGFKQMLALELTPLLRHPDQRIRLEAQWELASRPEAEREFVNLLTSGPTGFPEPQLARLHAIWGLGSVARRAEYKTPGAAAKMLAPLIKLLEDEDEEVRAQAAKVLGENRVAAAYDGLLRTLRDPRERVSYFSAMALGQLGRKECIPQVLLMVRENEGRDVFLRHAYVTALAGTKDVPALVAAAKSGNVHVRMAVLLALRRLESPEIALFLNDADPLLVLEAGRAIHDLPIQAAQAPLAAFLAKPVEDKLFMLRALNANFRLGTAAEAQALTEFASRDSAPDGLRVEALRLLALWAAPPARDRVTGLYRPQLAHPVEPAATAFHSALPKLLAAKSEPVVLAALDTVAALKLKGDGAAVLALAGAKEASPAVRKSALEVLAALDDPKLGEAIRLALNDPSPALRITASALLAKFDPARAAGQLVAVLGQAVPSEAKSIIMALGGIPGPEADKAIAGLLDDLRAGKVAREVQVEVLEAAAKRSAPEVKARLQAYQDGLSKTDPLAAFAPVVVGGDKVAGEIVFKESAVAGCLRCHRIKGSGGEVGPDLTGIGAKKDRAFFLESIVLPNATIADGFQLVIATMKNGDIQAGFLKSETDAELVLQPPGTAPVTLKKADIKSREIAPSGMPPNLGDLLTKREIRDLVEYLTTLTEPPAIPTK
jgi:quinoprotein glucose dehydrogenase